MGSGAQAITINGEGAAPTVLSPPVSSIPPLPGDAQHHLLLRAMSDLRDEIEAEPPTSMRDAALLHVDDLDDAVSRDEPDLTTVGYVAQWFLVNLPDAAALVNAIAEATIRKQWVAELLAWKLGVERAGRHNRNLLQYGASMAALLGISAGGGGILALAKAVTLTQGDNAGHLLPEDGLRFVVALGVLGLAGAVVLGVLLYRAFRDRARAEAEADAHLSKLVQLRPEGFLPSGRA